MTTYDVSGDLEAEQRVGEQRDVEREALREHHEAEVDSSQVRRRRDALDLVAPRQRHHLFEGLLPGVHFYHLQAEKQRNTGLWYRHNSCSLHFI